MRRAEAIQILRDHRDELEENFGVRTLALFGSVAREEAAATSDVDLLVEFDNRPIGLFHLAALHERLRELLHSDRVDVVLRDAVYPALKANILREAIDVFTAEVGASR
jgi:predicted nucleotidyltransferase